MNYDDQIKSVILHSTDMTIEYSTRLLYFGISETQRNN
ncbi:hypothetical protein T4A_1717 [Trichinella pseudospiralis]|uniref:Uncharacterized protein n=1 Tax=Trichinella pseudospiralis TaxID=6337 RepID=A0A0V1DK38_TRIPS|nr:hypothetical protein T4A_1717 [Trichinella pseudospiralis]